MPGRFPSRWLRVAPLIAVVACAHVVRPSTAIRPDMLARTERRPESIRLRITDGYRRYVSTDRGHALADPQRYEIGPALAEVTKRFFRASFCEVVVGDAQTASGRVDFVVTPVVDAFDNRVSLTALRHGFELQLSATIASTRSAEVRRVTAAPGARDYGFEDRRNERTGRGELELPTNAAGEPIAGVPVITPSPGKDYAEKVLGRAIQDAVRSLVEQVGAELDSMGRTSEQASCPGG